MTSIKWNPNVKLILADVDETVADVYMPAEPNLLAELTKLLEENISLFFVTGGSLKRVMDGVIDFIPAELRWKILISHCSGAEVWGFTKEGNLNQKPFFSKYEEIFTKEQKDAWREIVQTIINEFKLVTHKAMPVVSFKKIAGDDPLQVMLDDRGPQITFEFVNGYDMQPDVVKQLETKVPKTHGAFDLRIPIIERVDELLTQNKIPVKPKLGGVFALDLAIEGVSKTTSIEYVLNKSDILSAINVDKSELNDPQKIEIWGDKYSEIRGGSDRYMCFAVDKNVRAIDFRDEDPQEFPKGYNINIWDGNKRLHHGLLEYLSERSLL